jgi:hypothetical protein
MNPQADSNTPPKSTSKLWRLIWLFSLFVLGWCSFQTVRQVWQWADRVMADTRANVQSIDARILSSQRDPIQTTHWLTLEYFQGDRMSRVKIRVPENQAEMKSLDYKVGDKIAIYFLANQPSSITLTPESLIFQSQGNEESLLPAVWFVLGAVVTCLVLAVSHRHLGKSLRT